MKRLAALLILTPLMVLAGQCEPAPIPEPRTPTPTILADYPGPRCDELGQPALDGFRIYEKTPEEELYRWRIDVPCFWRDVDEDEILDCAEEWICVLWDQDWPVQRGEDLTPGFEHHFCVTAYFGSQESETCTPLCDTELDPGCDAAAGEGTAVCWPRLWRCDETGCECCTEDGCFPPSFPQCTDAA